MWSWSQPWTSVLANILVTLGWRATRFVHALPFLALAWGFGWVNGYVWNGFSAEGLMPVLQAWLCFGIVVTGMCWSWFQEWRRGY